MQGDDEWEKQRKESDRACYIFERKEKEGEREEDKEKKRERERNEKGS